VVSRLCPLDPFPWSAVTDCNAILIGQPSFDLSEKPLQNFALIPIAAYSRGLFQLIDLPESPGSVAVRVLLTVSFLLLIALAAGIPSRASGDFPTGAGGERGDARERAPYDSS